MHAFMASIIKKKFKYQDLNYDLVRWILLALGDDSCLIVPKKLAAIILKVIKLVYTLPNTVGGLGEIIKEISISETISSFTSKYL